MRAGPQPTELGPVVAVYRPMFPRKAAMQRWQAESIRTNGDVLTNDIAPTIYRMHDAWRILCYVAGVLWVTGSTPVKSMQLSRLCHVNGAVTDTCAKPQSPFSYTVAVRYLCS